MRRSRASGSRSGLDQRTAVADIASMTGQPESPDPKAVKVRVGPAKCARCDKPVQPRTRPFCSQRCADLDLAAWLGESYRVPTNEAPPEPGAGADDDEN